LRRRIYEIADDGSEHAWGTVVSWDPPSGLSFTWHPGREVSTAQHVELSFEPAAEGTTVRLVHSGWEKLGKDAEHARPGYDIGWDLVFGTCFGGRHEHKPVLSEGAHCRLVMRGAAS
jgi:uncharacterized protein YndB with AHSA1/START domain